MNVLLIQQKLYENVSNNPNKADTYVNNYIKSLIELYKKNQISAQQFISLVGTCVSYTLQISDKLDEVIDFANDYDSYYKEFTEPQKIQYANELVVLYYK